MYRPQNDYVICITLDPIRRYRVLYIGWLTCGRYVMELMEI